jgi:hypothetical protein
VQKKVIQFHFPFISDLKFEISNALLMNCH